MADETPMADEQGAQLGPGAMAPEPRAEQATKARQIQNLGVLDLTGMKSPDDLAGIESIGAVGVILVPEPLVSKLGTIPMKAVGAVVPVPQGEHVKVLTGLVKLSGEALANPTVGEDTLVVAGVLQVTTPVEKVAYKRLVVAGVILAPKGSESAIGAAISRLEGATVYYSGNPRIFAGSDRFSSAFFELLEDRTSVVLVGGFVVEPDVTPDLLKRKVAEIMLVGALEAPRALVPLLQVLTTERQGVISAIEDKEKSHGQGQ
jgi:hypothetical protein